MHVFAFLGPESTGKTTTSLLAAKSLNADYVQEISRTFLQDIGLNYTYEDILQIAELQKNLEQKAIEYKTEMVVLDSELITIEIWLEFYGYKVPDWIPSYILQCQYHYFLLNTDVPWVADALRNNPNDRLVLFNLFEEKLKHYQKQYTIISGLKKYDWIEISKTLIRPAI